MSKEEAKKILNQILRNPGLADQFTEEEVEEMERLASS